MNNRQEAKKLMLHYFGLMAERSGIPLDSDNRAEIDYMVDCLIDAAKQELENEAR